jgi:hypothetical protein
MLEKLRLFEEHDDFFVVAEEGDQSCIEADPELNIDFIAFF